MVKTGGGSEQNLKLGGCLVCLKLIKVALLLTALLEGVRTFLASILVKDIHSWVLNCLPPSLII